MTPAERVVVEAAIRFVAGTLDGSDGTLHTLEAAVEALLTERAGPGAPTDATLTWGQVVEGDEIYSDNTRKWYSVLSAGPLTGTTRVRILARGLPKAVEPQATAPVRVRRGPAGQAVDMFATVLWSGTSGPIIPESKAGPAPELDAAHDPEATEPAPIESEDE